MITRTLKDRKALYPEAINDLTKFKIGYDYWLIRKNPFSECISKETFWGFEFQEVDGNVLPYMRFAGLTNDGFAADRGVVPYHDDRYNTLNVMFERYADAVLAFYPSEAEIEIEEAKARERAEERDAEELLDGYMPLIEMFGFTRDEARAALGQIRDVLSDAGVEFKSWKEIDGLYNAGTETIEDAMDDDKTVELLVQFKTRRNDGYGQGLQEDMMNAYFNQFHKAFVENRNAQ